MNELADKLDDLASGNGYHGQALLDALGLDLTMENKQMLRRYLYGAHTGNDMHSLHGLAITLRGMK
tara:strand:+ start:171 stop:368 length:198 start_codon:yes stop_codon:yes gene_type:complete